MAKSSKSNKKTPKKKSQKKATPAPQVPKEVATQASARKSTAPTIKPKNKKATAMAENKKNKNTASTAKPATATKTKSVKTSASAKQMLAAVASDTATKPKTPRKGNPPTKQAPKPVLLITHEQIARKAYEIWLAKGCPQGQDHANWLEAKAQLEQG